VQTGLQGAGRTYETENKAGWLKGELGRGEQGRLLAPLSYRAKPAMSPFGPFRDLPTSTVNVRVRGQSGKKYLALNSSQFDPERALGDVSLPFAPGRGQLVSP
jgi:hypothetical protein